MHLEDIFGAETCKLCESSEALPFDISMAFQPIVDITSFEVFGHEACVRGPEGQDSDWVLAKVNESNRYRFDQTCRVRAIQLAAELNLKGYLTINFMPNAVYQPEMCIRTTLRAADIFGFPIDRIMFEITESERVDDVPHLRNIIEHYKKRGFLTAIDDFGAGFAGLNLLAELQTDFIKLDIALTRGIDTDRIKPSIVRGALRTCRELGIGVIAEGVETEGELNTLKILGVELCQGHLIAYPELESLPSISWPSTTAFNQ